VTPVCHAFDPALRRAARFSVRGDTGLWERWGAPEGPAVETFTILTTTANDLVAQFHDRMPVIIDRENHAGWLDPEASWADDLRPLLAPFAAAKMEAFAVSTLVNSPGVDDERCAEPWGR